MQKKICLCTAVMFLATCPFAISIKPLKMPTGRAISRSTKVLNKRVLRKRVAVSSPSVAREIMNPSSPMITSHYYQARQVYSHPPLLHKLQNKIRRLVAVKPRLLSAEYVAKKAHTSYSLAEYAQTPVNGYMDQPWKTLLGKEQFLKDMENRLAEVYPGQEARYYGKCFAGLNNIEYVLSKGWHADQTLPEAMERAYRSTMSTKSESLPGFFVIGMATQEGGPLREAFILDFKNQQWISFNQSKAAGWREAVQKAPISEKGARLAYEQLDVHYKLTHEGEDLLANKVLSNDGITGVVLTEIDQLYVKKALEKGYYIHLEPLGKVHPLTLDMSRELGGMTGLYDGYRISFATDKGQPLKSPKQLFPEVKIAE